MKHLYNIKLHRLCASVVFIFFITGCGSAKIKPQTITEKIIELAETNNKLIILNYLGNNQENFINVGHQYAFFLFPLGNIFLERPEDILFNKLYQELTLKGFKPLSIAEIDNKYNIPILNVKIVNSSTSAYDFLFLRRISSNITLEFNMLNKNRESITKWTVTENYSEWKEFAFELQLNYVFNKALTKTIKKGISELNQHIKSH